MSKHYFYSALQIKSAPQTHQTNPDASRSYTELVKSGFAEQKLINICVSPAKLLQTPGLCYLFLYLLIL